MGAGRIPSLPLQLQSLLEKEGKANADLTQRLERQQARTADLQKSLEVRVPFLIGGGSSVVANEGGRQAAHLAEVDAENGRRAVGLELQAAKERLEGAIAATATAEAESAELLAEVRGASDTTHEAH